MSTVSSGIVRRGTSSVSRLWKLVWNLVWISALLGGPIYYGLHHSDFAGKAVGQKAIQAWMPITGDAQDVLASKMLTDCLNQEINAYNDRHDTSPNTVWGEVERCEIQQVFWGSESPQMKATIQRRKDLAPVGDYPTPSEVFWQAYAQKVVADMRNNQDR